MSVVVLAGCDATFATVGGRQRCGVDVLYQIQPAGFTAAQIQDIKWAAESVAAFSGVRYRFDTWSLDTYESEPSPPIFRVEKHTAYDSGGLRRWAVTAPRTRNGVIEGGVMLVDPNADQAATGVGFGAAGYVNKPTYLKLLVHEWMHETGLADVKSSENLMGNIYLNGYGLGDLYGLQQVGCTNPKRAIGT